MWVLHSISKIRYTIVPTAHRNIKSKNIIPITHTSQIQSPTMRYFPIIQQTQLIPAPIHIDFLHRILQLMEERGWTNYRLAKRGGPLIFQNKKLIQTK